MTWGWTKEDVPCWDEHKQRLFGDAELASVGIAAPAAAAPLADEWWRVTDDAGTIVGYGWLDSEWGDAEIRFVVDAGRRGAGIGEFIVDRLDREAAGRGLNYIYNTVPGTHPAAEWMTRWLTGHGFVAAGDGELRRRVRTVRG